MKLKNLMFTLIAVASLASYLYIGVIDCKNDSANALKGDKIEHSEGMILPDATIIKKLFRSITF